MKIAFGLGKPSGVNEKLLNAPGLRESVASLKNMPVVIYAPISVSTTDVSLLQSGDYSLEPINADKTTFFLKFKDGPKQDSKEADAEDEELPPPPPVPEPEEKKLLKKEKLVAEDY
eukprot:GHVR01144086.1.p1 GENE.GHVR01144086.1~~GHVR01144086.1.p1  ORF type:complete len:116 (-),score=24.30 GHVR01144086.1:159-506(-)